jgi:predicted  nucleic acid-binding Zn-ribbon protein
MAQNQQFLQDFQSSMDKLNGMSVMIQNSIIQKKEFSDKLIAKLKNINDKIKDLAGQVNKLKADIDGLKGVVSNNSTSISEKDNQISDLTQKLNALEREKQQMAQQLVDFQKQCGQEKTTLQQKIDADEAEIRKLSEDNELFKKQSDALTSELSNKSDMASQHAEQLKMQTDEFQTHMTKAQQENQDKINGLMAQIKDCDDKMFVLQKQLKDKTDEVAAHAQSITDVQNQGQSQIAQLNQQVEALKNENDKLAKRIIAATQAIRDATEKLEILANSVPNQESQQYIENLFSEIEESIKNISGVIQGNPSTRSVSRPNEYKIPLNETINYENSQFNFRDLLAQLWDKSKNDNRVDNNYSATLNQLRNASDEDDVNTILLQNNIGTTNGKITGGKKFKKTKKNRKQKGGFTYKIKSKRKSISSTSSIRSSGRGRGHTKRI